MTGYTRRQALAAGVTVALGTSAGCLDNTDSRDVTVLDRSGVITGVETAVGGDAVFGLPLSKTDTSLRVTIDDGDGEYTHLQIVLVGDSSTADIVTWRPGDGAVTFEEAATAALGDVEPNGDAATVLALHDGDVVGSASFRVVRT